MSYLQFGGINQNLKSSSLENLKVSGKLYALDESTIYSCRFIKNFSFTEDSTNIFDLNAYKRFFEIKNASEPTGTRIPLNFLDVSFISIKEDFIITSLILGNTIKYESIQSSQNLIVFKHDGLYQDISGQSNIALGYYTLKDLSGNSNIAIGNQPTAGYTSFSLSNYNNNILIGNGLDFSMNYIDNNVVIGNDIKIDASNSIFLGNNLQNSLKTYAYFNVYNGFQFGLDISSSTFIFNNMRNYQVTQSNLAIDGVNSNTSSILNFYGASNYIKLDSGGNDPYSWKILLHANDSLSQQLNINKSLIFLSPAGRAYYLRDDPDSNDQGSTGAINITSFTGQHSVILSNNTTTEVGKIVISLGNYNNFSSGALKNLPNMNEALPLVSYTNIKNDKRCFGVVSNATKVDRGTGVYTYNEGPWSTQIASSIFKERCWVNSIGEGAILVTDSNGNFENGDFITTSNDEGYGIRQDDDILHSYTVAKITEDMDFTDSARVVEKMLNGVVRKTCLVGCTYHCG